MTNVPDSWEFPLHTEKLLSLPKEQQLQYFQELIFDLKKMYEILAYGINGDLLTDTQPASFEYTPTLDGSTSGAFTYDHQVGWAYRQGIFVDVWFDVKWTATAASGTLLLDLPYRVALTNEKPFVGIVQASGITYTGGTEMVLNAVTDTYTADFYNTGTGFTTAQQNVVASGQLIGHLRYIGQDND